MGYVPMRPPVRAIRGGQVGEPIEPARRMASALLTAIGFFLGIAALFVACGYKVPGPTAITQGNMVVTDSLRVGASGAPRPTYLSGDVDIWGNVTFHGAVSGGSSSSELTGSKSMTFDLSTNPTATDSVNVSGAVVGHECKNPGVALALFSDSIFYQAQCTSTNWVRVTARRICGSTLSSRTGTVRVSINP